MTEQEWLERHADLWMHDRDITPVFSPDLPPVSECGYRVMLDPIHTSVRSPLKRFADPEWVEFYAVFGGREVTTKRRVRDMTCSAPRR